MSNVPDLSPQAVQQRLQVAAARQQEATGMHIGISTAVLAQLVAAEVAGHSLDTSRPPHEMQEVLEQLSALAFRAATLHLAKYGINVAIRKQEPPVVEQPAQDKSGT